MKHFEIDWAAMVALMPAWDRLSRPARAACLAMKPGAAGVRVEELRGAADELVESGLVSLSPTGVRAVVAERWRPFHVALRAMDRHRLWEAPSNAALVAYLEDVLTTQELQALLGDRGFGSNPYYLRVLLGDRVSGEEWVEDLLAAETPKAAAAWERKRSAAGEPGPSVFADAAVLDAARGLLRALAAEPAGAPLGDLPGRFPEMDAAVLGAAVRGCLRYLLLFASMTDGLVPTVGVWPDVAVRRRQAAQGPPAPVEVAETFEAAFRLEDMTTVLAAAAAEPLRLRASDRAVFARTREAIQDRLVSVPDWVEEVLGADPETRVETAARLLHEMDFAKAGEKAGEGLRLAPTRKGLRWLDLPDGERLDALIAPIRGSDERVPGSWYQGGRSKVGFFPVTLGFTAPAGVDLRKWVTHAFLEMPPGGMLEVGAFLEHYGRAENPFLRLLSKNPGALRVHWGRPTTRVEWERLWREVLATMISLRLAPLGGVRMGRTADGTPAFALTPVGRYLLGAEEQLEYEGGGGGGGGVVVQPNFEVVFLGPAPGVEARIARFAERAGKGPGTLFRITRRSVLGAAEAGFTADRVLETLAAASKHDLPANVARQVRDWFAATRRVRLRPAVLVECPDAETAARVLSAGGKAVRAVTDTLLELADTERAARSALLKKLREAGVFVAE
ncbi:MAG: helicase-associated domain-containing protein [Longimicrobiaceae bacterium]